MNRSAPTMLAAVRVVPMPSSAGSPLASSTRRPSTRPRASRSSRRRTPSSGSSRRKNQRAVSMRYLWASRTTRALARSPPAQPPIPSATIRKKPSRSGSRAPASGGRLVPRTSRDLHSRATRYWSSLLRRRWPGCVSAPNASLGGAGSGRSFGPMTTVETSEDFELPIRASPFFRLAPGGGALVVLRPAGAGGSTPGGGRGIRLPRACLILLPFLTLQSALPQGVVDRRVAQQGRHEHGGEAGGQHRQEQRETARHLGDQDDAG